MQTDQKVSRVILIGSLGVILLVAAYMIAGGFSPSGAPIAQVPVSVPANPERK